MTPPSFPASSSWLGEDLLDAAAARMHELLPHMSSTDGEALLDWLGAAFKSRIVTG